MKTIARILLGAMLAFAGVSHLTFARDEFDAQVPNSIPLDEDLVVVVSGVVEIALGAASGVQLTFNDGGLIVIGFTMAFISGLFVVRSLLGYVSRHGFALFGWWRLVVGAAGLAGLIVFG